MDRPRSRCSCAFVRVRARVWWVSEKHFAWYQSDRPTPSSSRGLRFCALICEREPRGKRKGTPAVREKRNNNNNGGKKNRHYYWEWGRFVERIKDDKNVCSYVELFYANANLYESTYGWCGCTVAQSSNATSDDHWLVCVLVCARNCVRYCLVWEWKSFPPQINSGRKESTQRYISYAEITSVQRDGTCLCLGLAQCIWLTSRHMKPLERVDLE